MKEENKRKGLMQGTRNLLVMILIALLVVAGALVGLIYWKATQSRVYVEKAEISAPLISLNPGAPGILDKIFVKEGDFVRKNAIIATVGDYNVQAKTEGIIIAVRNTPGQLLASQDYVAKMIDPREMRVVGRVEEDKGLSAVKIGQPVIFTVDAFGSKEYYGVVSEISPSARQSDIVFSISDKREEREFDVKAKFDFDAYPELKNGMSAKMWIYK